MRNNEEVVLNVKIRERKGKKISRRLKRENKIPAVVYGKDIKNINLEVDLKEFYQLNKQVSQNALLDLNFPDKKKVKVIMHDKAVHPITDEIIHVDFLKINLKQKVEVKVPLKFTGVSKAVKEGGGVLVKNMMSISMFCLPADIPDFVEVPINELNKIDDYLMVKDLKIDPSVEVMEKPDQVIAIITIQKREEEEKEVKSDEPTTDKEEEKEQKDKKEEKSSEKKKEKTAKSK